MEGERCTSREDQGDVGEEGGWKEGCSARLREDGVGDRWRDRWDRWDRWIGSRWACDRWDECCSATLVLKRQGGLFESAKVRNVMTACGEAESG